MGQGKSCLDEIINSSSGAKKTSQCVTLGMEVVKRVNLEAILLIYIIYRKRVRITFYFFFFTSSFFFFFFLHPLPAKLSGPVEITGAKYF